MSKAMETEPKLIEEETTIGQQFTEEKATQTEAQLTEAKKDGQNCLVNKDKAKDFLDLVRYLTEKKGLVKISKGAAVLIVQTALYFFGCLNYIQEGQKIVDLLIHPVTFQEDFDDVNNLVERLCLRHTQVVLAQIGLQ